MAEQQRSRAKAWLWLTVAYAVAAGVGVAAAGPVAAEHPYLVAGVADVAATLAVFAFSLGLGNSSVYDPYWSVAPPLIAAYFAYGVAPGDANPARAALVVGLVALWGARLTYSFLRGWPGLHHEDWRYRNLREKSGRAYWLVSLSGIHLFPTLLVFAGCVALLPAVSSNRPLGWLDAVAAVVTLGAIGIETVADRQLSAFVASGPPRGAILKTGLWSVSRHPNYFGEASFWWGLWLFALAAEPDAGWTSLGAALITGLFVFISIPMMDKRMLERRPHFAEHQRRVSALVPWFPKRG